MMKAIRLFEWHEQSWLPHSFREGVTAYLSRLFSHYNMYKPAIPLLANLIRSTKKTHIVDLCSGSGGMWPDIQKALLTDYDLRTQVELTDKLPEDFLFNKHADSRNIQYRHEPLDALKITSSVNGIRTIFSAFHHFNPDEAKLILSSAVKSGDPIAIFEFTENRFLRYILDLFVPVSVIRFNHQINPKSKLRSFFTYCLPIIPLIIWWDAAISNLRTYSPKQLQSLVNSLDSALEYDWEIGKKTAGLRFLNISYLIGKPKS